MTEIKEDIKVIAEPTLAEAADLLYTGWTIIANASEGDWTKETKEWQEAAKRWRDNFHEFLGRIHTNG